VLHPRPDTRWRPAEPGASFADRRDPAHARSAFHWSGALAADAGPYAPALLLACWRRSLRAGLAADGPWPAGWL